MCSECWPLVDPLRSWDVEAWVLDPSAFNDLLCERAFRDIRSDASPFVRFVRLRLPDERVVSKWLGQAVGVLGTGTENEMYGEVMALREAQLFTEEESASLAKWATVQLAPQLFDVRRRQLEELYCDDFWTPENNSIPLTSRLGFNLPFDAAVQGNWLLNA